MSRCCIILNNTLKNLPVMMEASTGNLNLGLKTKFLLPESNEVDDVKKASETVCASSESDPLLVTDTSSNIDTSCHPEVEHLVTAVSVTSETTNIIIIIYIFVTIATDD